MAERARAQTPARAGRTAARDGNQESRNRLYRAIRAACARLGMDDDDRRAVQQERTGKVSMSAMTPGELGELLDHLNRNWQGPMAHRAHAAKIKALWWSLYWLGEVDDPDDRALSAFVRRQTGVASLRFLDHTRAPSVIEALRSWLGRAGVAWSSQRETDFIAANTPGFTAARHDRHRVLEAIAARAPREDGDWRIALVRALGLGNRPFAWTEHELDAAIRHLGRRARRARAEGAA